MINKKKTNWECLLLLMCLTDPLHPASMAIYLVTSLLLALEKSLIVPHTLRLRQSPFDICFSFMFISAAAAMICDCTNKIS